MCALIEAEEIFFEIVREFRRKIRQRESERVAAGSGVVRRSVGFRMHKADREGLLTRDVIQFIMSEEKPNQRETVKIPTEKLRKFAPCADQRQLEDFVLKACEHYRKYLIRQREREER